MKKYCVVCGSENFSRSKLYCSLKCKHQDYYRKNKKELLERHNEWNKENYEKVKEQSKQWKEDNRELYLKYLKEWREKNNEKSNKNGAN